MEAVISSCHLWCIYRARAYQLPYIVWPVTVYGKFDAQRSHDNFASSLSASCTYTSQMTQLRVLEGKA